MESTLADYQAYLSRLPLSHHTRRNYRLRVKQYLVWLAASPDSMKALSDSVERDFAVQDYKTRLLKKGVAANTLNAILAALDNFYLFLGLGPAKVRRQDLPTQAPRALEADEQRRLLKAIAHSRSARNRTIVLIMLNCGLRISEVAQLNLGDVILSARKRELVVRCGKNGKRRIVPINRDLGEVLQGYFNFPNADPDAPLFLSQKGGRLSQQAIDRIVREFGRDAGIDLSSHCLRHTCITRLVRAGVDIVTVAEVAGHSRLETTRRYSLPTADVKIAAMEKLNYAT